MSYKTKGPQTPQTRARIQKMREAAKAGLSLSDVARADGISLGAASNFLRAHGLSWTGIGGQRAKPTWGVRGYSAPASDTRAAAKPRACLTCRDTFLSEHVGHRMCSFCRTAVADESPLISPYALVTR